MFTTTGVLIDVVIVLKHLTEARLFVSNRKFVKVQRPSGGTH